MWGKKTIDDGDLTPYITKYDDRSPSSQLKALYEQQKRFWREFRNGHHSMEKAETRRVRLDSWWVLCQYNSNRLASVSAQVDPISTTRRSCFLCPQNLYPQERALPYGEEYFILCNVSPIFDFHFVVTHRDHVTQQIQGHFQAALRLVRDLSPHFVFIYNGPRCGASAPDHLHFQVFPGKNLPLASQVWVDHTLSFHEILARREEILIAAPTGFSRRFLIFESNNSVVLSFWFDQALEVLAEGEDKVAEPRINLVIAYEAGLWRMILFPRGKHRPRCYYGREDDQLLVSPGAIDMAGVFVLPRKKDYDRVNAEILYGIYQEVTLDEDRFSRLIEKLRENR